uniref:Uncharacterized protein n=1 Tax=Anguilla anguilla TaxID=7936 RepID=A0A0E9WHA5_ANGAN
MYSSDTLCHVGPFERDRHTCLIKAVVQKGLQFCDIIWINLYCKVGIK